MLDASAVQEPESHFAQVSGLPIDDFTPEADAGSLHLTKAELAGVLLAVGAKYHYGLAPEVQPGRAQVCAFWRSLQIRDLALAHACALGREAAWQEFLKRYREPLTQAAIAITASASLGPELSDSLYSEMFGLTDRDGQRRSPLASYAGRGSLMGFLRTTLAQRHVDHHRRTRRESPLEGKDFPAEVPSPVPPAEILSGLCKSLKLALESLKAEERFLLSSHFLDRRTLHEIAQVLRMHEATVSRKLRRLTSGLHKQLLKNLQASGMSRHAAEEALGTDPRDLNINLRSLLQHSAPAAFLEQGDRTDGEKA